MAILPRPVRFIFLAIVGIVVPFAQNESEASLDVPTYPQPYFVAGWEDKDLRRLKWSEAIRYLKRNQGELSSDMLQFFSEEQVETATKLEYKVVPHPFVYTSQILHEGLNCSSIQTNLHRNFIRSELQLRPDWIYKSEMIGDCPTHYVARELPPMYSPAVVLEAVCTCGGSQCSQSGHQCVPVSRHVPVWVRRAPNFHVLDVEELTVACACLRRPSAEGNFIYAAAIQS